MSSAGTLAGAGLSHLQSAHSQEWLCYVTFSAASSADVHGAIFQIRANTTSSGAESAGGASPGQRPGFRYQTNAARPAGAQGSSAPYRADGQTRHDTRGVAPGWYPPRRWRGNTTKLSRAIAAEETFKYRFANQQNCQRRFREESLEKARARHEFLAVGQNHSLKTHGG